jgi:hypothetical protein
MAVSPNNTLDILIRTKAELQGAVDTAKSLEQQIGKAKALGKEYGNLEAQLVKVRSTIAEAKGRENELTDSFKDQAKHSEFLGLKHAQLHKVVHQLTEAFPEAGMAARAFMNPVLLAFTAAVAIFAKAKEKLAEWNAEMDEAAKKAAEADFQQGIAARTQALRSGMTAMADFSESLRSIGKADDEVVKAIDRSIAKLHEQESALAAVNTAAEGKELAQTNFAEKGGRISPDQAARQRAAIKEKYEKLAAALKTETENRELAAKQQELEHSQASKSTLESAAKEKMDALAVVESRLADATASLEAARTKEAEHREAANQAGDKLTQLRPEIAARAAAIPDASARQLYLSYKGIHTEMLAEKEEEERGLADKNRGLAAGYQKTIQDISIDLPHLRSESKVA